MSRGTSTIVLLVSVAVLTAAIATSASRSGQAAGSVGSGPLPATSPAAFNASVRPPLPPSAPFDQWLKATGMTVPDFDSLPAVPYPQDPLVTVRDGKPHRVTREEWPARRAELRTLVQDWLLGHAPPPPGNVRGVVEEKRREANHEVWTVRLEFGPDHAARLHCWLWVPDNLKVKPAPVYLVDNQRYTSFARDAFDRGEFLICVYNATDPVYVADKKDESEAYKDLFGKYDWSEFLRRGWSASRALDWLSTLDFVDKDRAYIGGHSRSAKQSLAGAAIDERIAGVIASSPGSGGSLPYRYCDGYVFGESVELLTRGFPYWVYPRARFFSGRENKLPADHPMEYALIAPRPVLMSTAIHDDVENTFAVEQMYALVHPVYDMLGKGGNLVVRYRDGGHPPDAATQSAHSQFLTLAAAGKVPAEAFPFKPYHPWNYDAWAAKNATKVDLAALPDRSASSVLRNERSGDIRPAQWPARRDEVRQQINWLLGDGPTYAPAKVMLGVGESDDFARVVRRTDNGPGGRLKLRITNPIGDDGVFATINASIYYPRGGKDSGQKFPTVVWLAPFNCSGGYYPGYRSGDPPYLTLAKAGFIVVCFDPIGAAERQEERRGFYDRHPTWSLMGQMVQDARRALDAAAACPEVDPKRVYLVGYGIGGMTAVFTAALDDRPAAVASVAGFTPFRTDTDDKGTGGLRRWSHLYAWLPRLGAFAGGNEGRVPVDFPEVLACAAPRPALVVAPTVDWHATTADVVRSVESAKSVYSLLGKPDELGVQTPERRNELDNATQGDVVRWLKGL